MWINISPNLNPNLNLNLSPDLCPNVRSKKSQKLMSNPPPMREDSIKKNHPPMREYSIKKNHPPIRRLLFSNVLEYSKTSLFQYSFSFQNVLIRTARTTLLEGSFLSPGYFILSLCFLRRSATIDN